MHENFICNKFKVLVTVLECLFLCHHYLESFVFSLLTLLYMFLLLRSHGDIELNPGPRKSNDNNLSVCHWNLNSITAHKFSKLTQLKAYISTYKYDLICLSETYLDSCTQNNLIDIEGYNLVCADHPDDTKRGGICICYKESLPVKIINLPYFKEALFLEMSDNKNKVIVSVIYRSPSQTNDEFGLFLSNLEKRFSDINKLKSSLSVVTDDFNARSFSWWSDDINTTEGTNLFSLTFSNGFSELINEPTHIQTNSSPCIDLIFTDQPNLSMNSGVHSSLHPNCHHQLVHSSFNLNIHYPPPYQRLTWDYKKADSIKIREAFDSVNWARLFDKKGLNAQVITLSEVILNVFRNYVPNNYITIDDKDPVWMNETIKNKMKVRNNLFKQYIQNRRFESDFILIERLGNELSDLISQTKALYYENLARILNNPLLQAKTYWSILKTFYNDKKVPLIPPLLIGDKFMTDIKTKANIFNNFFADQCTPLKNNSIPPTNQIFLTQARLEFWSSIKVKFSK